MGEGLGHSEGPVLIRSVFQIQVCTRQTAGFTPEEPQGPSAGATGLGPASRSQLEGKDPVVKWGRDQTEYWLGGGADQFFPSADPQGRGGTKSSSRRGEGAPADRGEGLQQAGGGALAGRGRGSSRQREGHQQKHSLCRIHTRLSHTQLLRPEHRSHLCEQVGEQCHDSTPSGEARGEEPTHTPANQRHQRQRFHLM